MSADEYLRGTADTIILNDFIRITVIIALAFTVSVPAQQTGIAYRVQFSGVEDGKLEARLRALSDSVGQQDTRSRSLFQLRRRAERDEVTLMKGLKAEGFYAAMLSFTLEDDGGVTIVRFLIDPGPQYRFASIVIDFEDKPENFVGTFQKVPPKVLISGELAWAQEVVDAEQALLRHLREEGYRFAESIGREVIVEHSTFTMDVTYHLNAGPLTRFGMVQVSGLEGVKEEVVLAEVPWKLGDQYKESLLERLRKRLYETGLFSVVRLRPAESLDDSEKLPINIELTERDKRTIWSGVEYFTDEGIGTGLGWEHRNLRGLGHRLTLEARFSETRLQGKSEYRMRNFHRSDQTLRLGIEGGRYRPEAFSQDYGRVSALIDRPLREKLTGSLGIALKISEVEQFDETDSFTLVSLPAELLWDGSDRPLNATSGFKVRVRSEPFVDPIEQDTSFMKSSITTNYYLPLVKEGKLVIATRLMLGAIVGESVNGVPADERFYAGGGGSIRGYTFQTVGPLNGDEPTGGGSKIEIAVEIRYRMSEHLGVVAFVDAGSAFTSSLPDFGEELLFGAGLGLRYFSPIGPLRLDVALPLDRRDGIDESFQLYLSIGQAF
ncbi:MAG TPA: outer membrane protein assembly factor [Candidatus Hydrogenedentes bacterium]|nr:outer membrane protein assembly factor [Candidatus Hydrogenedentota bacterium]